MNKNRSSSNNNLAQAQQAQSLQAWAEAQKSNAEVQKLHIEKQAEIAKLKNDDIFKLEKDNLRLKEKFIDNVANDSKRKDWQRFFSFIIIVVVLSVLAIVCLLMKQIDFLRSAGKWLGIALAFFAAGYGMSNRKKDQKRVNVLDLDKN